MELGKNVLGFGFIYAKRKNPIGYCRGERGRLAPTLALGRRDDVPAAAELPGLSPSLGAVGLGLLQLEPSWLHAVKCWVLIKHNGC